MMSPRANIYFLFISIAAQIIAFVSTNFVFELIRKIFPKTPFSVLLSLIIFTVLISVIAFLISYWLKLPKAWRAFNLCLAPALVLYELYAMPPTILLIAAILSLLIYLPTFWTRIPYYPTSHASYLKISELVAERNPEKFIDLGSGFAPLLFYLAKAHPQTKFYGSEISPLPYLVSKLRSKLLGTQNLEISKKSFWDINLSDYDFVYAFLAPPPMQKIWQKVKAEMRKGTVFVSNTFEAPSMPDEVHEINDKRKCKLLIYRL